MHIVNPKNRLALIFLLLCLFGQSAGQDLPPETRYELLLVRVTLSQAEQDFDSYSSQLLEKAQQLAKDQEFELAIVYLEELLAETDDSIQSLATMDNNPVDKFQVSVSGGIDFNHQEFETGYFQDDSTILEEIRNPYTGCTLRYNTFTGLDFRTALRLDQENYRNDLSIGWTPVPELDIRYSNYWNHARRYTENSFVENGLDIKAVAPILPGVSWMLENNFRYKTYTSKNTYYLDFYRNRLQTGLTGSGWNIQYGYERYENLGGEDTDYQQHLLRGGLFGFLGPGLGVSLSPDIQLRNYVLRLGDSLAVNRYLQLGVYLTADLTLSERLRLGLEDNFIYKLYREKSTIEPDYYLNFFRPALVFSTSRNFDISLGFEWEIKQHRPVPDDLYDVSEQNYNSSGVSGGVSYMAPNGAYLMLNLGYQWRRYPDSVSKEIISLYSSRNILSVMLMGYIPLGDALILNLFAIYDDDQDIDFDQQNNQSTIFTLELEYLF